MRTVIRGSLIFGGTSAGTYQAVGSFDNVEDDKMKVVLEAIHEKASTNEIILDEMEKIADECLQKFKIENPAKKSSPNKMKTLDEIDSMDILQEKDEIKKKFDMRCKPSDSSYLSKEEVELMADANVSLSSCTGRGLRSLGAYKLRLEKGKEVDNGSVSSVPKDFHYEDQNSFVTRWMKKAFRFFAAAGQYIYDVVFMKKVLVGVGILVIAVAAVQKLFNNSGSISFEQVLTESVDDFFFRVINGYHENNENKEARIWRDDRIAGHWN